MFGTFKETNSKKAPGTGPRPVANLRVYHTRASAGELAGIYIEQVVGGFRVRSGESYVMLVRGADGKSIHQFALFASRGLTHYLGEMSTDHVHLYEKTAPGDSFTLHGVRAVRLTKEEISRSVFSHPVWINHQLGSGEVPLPSLPHTARTMKHSISVHYEVLSRYVRDMSSDNDALVTDAVFRGSSPGSP